MANDLETRPALHFAATMAFFTFFVWLAGFVAALLVWRLTMGERWGWGEVPILLGGIYAHLKAWHLGRRLLRQRDPAEDRP